MKKDGLTIAERDAALAAKLGDMEGGSGAVEEKEWNGMSRNVKANMVGIVQYANNMTLDTYTRAT